MVHREVTTVDPLSVDVSGIPAELRDRPQWVGWRLVVRNGKSTKVPYTSTGEPASVSDQGTWTTFEAAVEAYRNMPYDGVGFVFTQSDPYTGVDLDKCRDPKTGMIEPWAWSIVQRLNSYTETSPSGTGVHIIIRAKVNGTRRRKGNVEMYDCGRYFCFTGRHVDGTSKEVRDGQEALDSLCVETFGNGRDAVTLPPQSPKVSNDDEDDDELIERARHAANGEKFAMLWAGQINGYQSQSEADLALCSILAYWCDGRREQIDRLFRRSVLYREKWERDDYRNSTIDKAINQVANMDKSECRPVGTMPSPPSKHLTEQWTAQRLVERHGKDLRWCPTSGWLIWDGTRWRRDETGEVYRRAKATIRELYGEAGKIDDDDERAKLVNHAKGCERAVKLKAIVELAKTEPGVPILVDHLDTDPWLLNVQNGTIDLRTGKRREHRREDFITKMAPVDYDSKAGCPTWTKFLDDLFESDAEMIGFVERALGYALTGVTHEHVLHVLYGTGANGKSTLIECITGMLGDYAMPAAPGLLFHKKSEQHPTERADLWGKRFVADHESGDGRRFNEELVKRLTGGDRIKGRFMNRDFFSFGPTHKLFLATNHKPLVRGTDRAVWRRVLVWTFKATFYEPGENGSPVRDVKLPDKLRAEWPGILARLVQGCLEWQERGLAPPESVTTATRAYRTECDTIDRFIRECCELGRGFEMPAGALYASYRRWASGSGVQLESAVEFSRQLLQQPSIERIDERTRRYTGIRVRNELVVPGDA